MVRRQARIDCECGTQYVWLHDNPVPVDAAQLLRTVCDCGQVNFVRLDPADGSNVYKMRDATFRIRANILNEFAEQDPPMGVRQMYYRMSVKDVVPKTDSGYDKIQYHLVRMRRNGSVPYSWVADGTRWQIKPTTYSGLRAALEHTRKAYRRSLWDAQDVHVEFWVEKLALAGILSGVTDEYDVGLLPARGYSSDTFLHKTAEKIKGIGKPAFVYHLGDFDPSGQDAARDICEKLEYFGADVQFVQLAVTEGQIDTWDLPTRPTKKSDPRSGDWGDKPSVELDAIPPRLLRGIVRDAIERHVDMGVLERMRQIEAEERRTLRTIECYLADVVG